MEGDDDANDGYQHLFWIKKKLFLSDLHFIEPSCQSKKRADSYLILLDFTLFSVKILGLSKKKLYKGFYAINVVPYICEDDI